MLGFLKEPVRVCKSCFSWSIPPPSVAPPTQPLIAALQTELQQKTQELVAAQKHEVEHENLKRAYQQLKEEFSEKSKNQPSLIKLTNVTHELKRSEAYRQQLEGKLNIESQKVKQLQQELQELQAKLQRAAIPEVPPQSNPPFSQEDVDDCSRKLNALQQQIDAAVEQTLSLIQASEQKQVPYPTSVAAVIRSYPSNKSNRAILFLLGHDSITVHSQDTSRGLVLPSRT